MFKQVQSFLLFISAIFFSSLSHVAHLTPLPSQLHANQADGCSYQGPEELRGIGWVVTPAAVSGTELVSQESQITNSWSKRMP